MKPFVLKKMNDCIFVSIFLILVVVNLPERYKEVLFVIVNYPFLHHVLASRVSWEYIKKKLIVIEEIRNCMLVIIIPFFHRDIM